MTTGERFEVGERDFCYIRDFIRERVGIQLSDKKKTMVQGRLARRIRALGLENMGEYLEIIRDPDSDELSSFVNALTTNLSSFFREDHHFALLAERLFTEHEAGRNRRLRLWSSACSTGQEPYSMGITVHQHLRNLSQWDIKILATDVDSDVIAKAKRGEYEGSEIDKFSADRAKYFQRSRDGERVRVQRDVADLVRFRQLNLLDRWPFRGPFDAVFCRNVLIYFGSELQLELVDRLVRYVRPGGFLCLGHSESACGQHPDLEPVGKTAFRRRGS